ncbi:hypothetical protein C4D60_Mb00t00820 [Musa balbisiana]|uniref:Uncharacterized protein n=1 Tax=Musa balbisiana TaxID=52838 RepID=A0A4S8I4X5_MUSBA|nr:hypothetical protein C4D60_Mb00t00820 [Musa balbisiana]
MCKCRSQEPSPLRPSKICTDGRSARARALGFAATAAPSYSSGLGARPDGRGVGRALQRHPFSGLVDSAGELLHTP